MQIHLGRMGVVGDSPSSGSFPGGGSYACDASGACEITQAPDTPTSGYFPSGATYQCDAAGSCVITQPTASTGLPFGLTQNTLLLLAGGVLLLTLMGKK